MLNKKYITTLETAWGAKANEVILDDGKVHISTDSRGLVSIRFTSKAPEGLYDDFYKYCEQRDRLVETFCQRPDQKQPGRIVA